MFFWKHFKHNFQPFISGEHQEVLNFALYQQIVNRVKYQAYYQAITKFTVVSI